MEVERSAENTVVGQPYIEGAAVPDAPPETEPGPQALAIGSKVKVVVTGIARYGVFVATYEGHRGLIHISEISDWFVEDARDYFRVGEEVEVMVIAQEEKTGKYAFSTRRLGGKHPLTDPGVGRLLHLHRTSGAWSNGRELASHFSTDKQDKYEIIKFIQRRVGDIASEARDELDQLIARHGAVRVALAVAEVSRHFDHSLAFVQWVGRKLDQR